MIVRALRGGSWFYTPWNLRSADRYWFGPDYRISYRGFRVAVRPDKYQVMRGGSWLDEPEFLRSANRNTGRPWRRNRREGFRVVVRS